MSPASESLRSPCRIGWIGTGVMGLPMAGHLLDAGHALCVHTRTAARARTLLDRGATWAATPRDAAEDADVVFSIVGMPDDVAVVHLGPEGTLTATRPPRYLVEMTTSRPDLAVEIHARAAECGVGALDAPVSGGDIGARNATLSIMLGGDADTLDAVRPLLLALGRSIVHLGPAGAGQHTKMVNQILIASMMLGVCEGLLYARRAGLDAERVIEAVGSGAAGSWSINQLGPRMVRRDFEPGFRIDHFLKDLGIALDSACAMNLCVPGLALARQFYEAASAQGHAEAGTHALLLAYERLCGIEV